MGTGMGNGAHREFNGAKLQSIFIHTFLFCNCYYCSIRAFHTSLIRVKLEYFDSLPERSVHMLLWVDLSNRVLIHGCGLGNGVKGEGKAGKTIVLRGYRRGGRGGQEVT